MLQKIHVYNVIAASWSHHSTEYLSSLLIISKMKKKIKLKFDKDSKLKFQLKLGSSPRTKLQNFQLMIKFEISYFMQPFLNLFVSLFWGSVILFFVYGKIEYRECLESLFLGGTKQEWLFHWAISWNNGCIPFNLISIDYGHFIEKHHGVGVVEV